MAEATAEDFLEIQDYADTPVTVLGLQVHVRTFTCADRDEVFSKPPEAKEGEEQIERKVWLRAKAIEIGVRNSNGEKMFTLFQALEMVGKRNKAAEFLSGEVLQGVNKLEEEAAEEEAKKLAEGNESGNSPS